MRLFSICLVAGLSLASTTAIAQQLKTPQESPRATVMQTIGLTEITVDYHRPAVNGRKVWGSLVAFNDVWRAGANQNTTVQFSTDVKVGGKLLKAGTYGLHMLPTAKQWTVMFSTVTTAWGSYSYNEKEDALRITVTPKAVTDHEERLLFKFDDPQDKKVTLTLAWEKLEVPIAIEVDTPNQVMANMRRELRGGLGFTWQAWNQAANYWFKNGGNLDEAIKHSDRSVGIAATYGNLMLRAQLLEKKGNAAGAKEARAKAVTLANENDLNLAGYQLLGAKKIDEAIAQFQAVVQKYPESWNARDSLGEALAIKGDKAGAIASYEKAFAMVKDEVNKKRIKATIAKLKTK
jgi:tetratricopeptide (TPR) repeat protein